MTNKEMPLSEAIRIMKIERECVLRKAEGRGEDKE